MPYVVMGARIGSEKLLPIATMFVDEQNRLVIKADDAEVRVGLGQLAEQWLHAGGFIAHVGRSLPNDDTPESHESYAIAMQPGDAHFDWALDSVVSRYWTGERVGGYEINGFASHLE